MDLRPISADSHITEPPNCYIDYIEPKYRDVAPHIVYKEGVGDTYVIEGMDNPIPMGLVAAAGKAPEELKLSGARWDSLHRSGWDAKYRIADQERDHIAAEIIYPSVGMMLCNHPDFAYKRACMKAYNRWLLDYASEDRQRLIPLAQIAMSSVDEAIADLHEIKRQGFAGVMMSGTPAHEDYDSLDYDRFWQTAIDLELPLSFHILTGKSDAFGSTPRGPRINMFMSIIRGCQDIMGMLVFSGVFERNPGLKIVCVEADAGWAPHFMYRMDHAYDRHRYWMKCAELKKMPSEYFREHIYMTFQDDYVAFRTADLVNTKRLMWANDFPHSDSTWPHSQQVLAEQASGLTTEQRADILRNNVVELYRLAA